MRSLVPILASALALAACGSTPGNEGLRVTDAWVRLPAFANSPGAAYFIVHGGQSADTLERITGPSASRIDLHGPGMRPLGPQDVAAGGELAFAPAGRHAMIFWSAGPPDPLTPVRLTLHFRSGRSVTVRAVAVAVGDPAPNFVDSIGREKECVSGVRREGNTLVGTNCG